MEKILSGIAPAPEAGRIWGVLGGMGPLASAEFLKTIYEYADLTREQNAPTVLVFSDPTFPDRTTALATGSVDELLFRLEQRMMSLLAAGATNIAICCLTIHVIFSRLPASLRQKAISLADLTVQAVCDSPFERHLLLCTNGSRQLNLFPGYESWPAERIVLPDMADQQQIHESIYHVKRMGDPSRFCDLLEKLLVKYAADCYIAGCTEVHLVTKAWKKSGHSCSFIDPLHILAAHIAGRRPVPGKFFLATPLINNDTTTFP